MPGNGSTGERASLPVPAWTLAEAKNFGEELTSISTKSAHPHGRTGPPAREVAPWLDEVLHRRIRADELAATLISLRCG